MKVKCVKDSSTIIMVSKLPFLVVKDLEYEVTSADFVGRPIRYVWIHGGYSSEGLERCLPVIFSADCFNIPATPSFADVMQNAQEATS